MSKIINLNIVLLPSKEVSQKAIELSQKISKEFEVFFVLNEESRIPHVSLYHSAYPAENIPKVKEVIEDIANITASFPVELTNVFWQKEGWLDFQADKSEPLINLHNQVVERLNSFRKDNLMESDKEDFSSLSKGEQESINLYGYRHARELFRPHLTITRLKNGNAVTVSKELDGNNLSFDATDIALCRLGNYGTCVYLLDSWNLK
jgi:2'-5' RNA ligase